VMVTGTATGTATGTGTVTLTETAPSPSVPCTSPAPRPSRRTPGASCAPGSPGPRAWRTVTAWTGGGPRRPRGGSLRGGCAGQSGQRGDPLRPPPDRPKRSGPVALRASSMFTPTTPAAPRAQPLPMRCRGSRPHSGGRAAAHLAAGADGLLVPRGRRPGDRQSPHRHDRRSAGRHGRTRRPVRRRPGRARPGPPRRAGAAGHGDVRRAPACRLDHSKLDALMGGLRQ
jgi:hypothetical protein